MPRVCFRPLLLALVASMPAASMPSANASEQPRQILLCRPVQLSPDASADWITASVQQSLYFDLSRGSAWDVKTAPSADSRDQAIDRARSAHADIVIYGTLQIAGRNIRFTGAALDVRTGRSLLSTKATASTDSLLEFEDELSARFQRALPTTSRAGRVKPVPAIVASGSLRASYASPDADAGLAYCRPYETGRFNAARDRYFYGFPAYGNSFYGGYCSFGCGYGFGVSWFPWVTAYSLP